MNKDKVANWIYKIVYCLFIVFSTSIGINILANMNSYAISFGQSTFYVIIAWMLYSSSKRLHDFMNNES
jgi:hypothetical protein